MGEGRVAHLTQVSNLSSSHHSNTTCGVIISDLASFMGTGKLYRYEYGVSKLARIGYRSGTCTTRISDPAEDVIRRANYLVENEVFGKYNLFTNNCEDYAIYCKTEYVVGNPYEDYGRSGQASTAVGVPVYLIRSLSLAGFLHPLGILAVAALSHAVKKYNADIGVREDGVRVPVENLAGFRRYYHLREENNEILQGLIPGWAGIVLCSD